MRVRANNRGHLIAIQQNENRMYDITDKMARKNVQYPAV